MGRVKRGRYMSNWIPTSGSSVSARSPILMFRPWRPWRLRGWGSCISYVFSDVNSKVGSNVNAERRRAPLGSSRRNMSSSSILIHCPFRH